MTYHVEFYCNSCATVFIGPPGQEQEEYTVVDD